jgi:arsenate reductase (thioredoxin)
VPDQRPSVLFVCVHNAGRSQMAAAYATHLSGGRVQVLSAGSAPADRINPAVMDVMLEEGIDLSAETPTLLTLEDVQASDVVITMGCGDACPYYPGKRYVDWQLDDPAGRDLEAVRPIRNEIRRRVTALLDELLPAAGGVASAGGGAPVADDRGGDDGDEETGEPGERVPDVGGGRSAEGEGPERVDDDGDRVDRRERL